MYYGLRKAFCKVIAMRPTPPPISTATALSSSNSFAMTMPRVVDVYMLELIMKEKLKERNECGCPCEAFSVPLVA